MGGAGRPEGNEFCVHSPPTDWPSTLKRVRRVWPPHGEATCPTHPHAPCCWSATARPPPPAPRSRVGPRACTSPTPGSVQAARAPRASPRSSNVDGGLRLAARAHPRDRGAHRQARSASRCTTDRGLLECDFGEWTGPSSPTCASCPSGARCSATPAAFRFPGGESFTEMQPRIVGAARPPRRRAPGPDASSSCRTPTRSRRRWPTRSAPTSTCSSASSSRRARSAPILLPPIGPSSSPSTPPATTSHRWCRRERARSTSTSPTAFTAGAIGEPGRRGLLPPGVAEGSEVVGQGARSSRSQLLAELPRPAARRPHDLPDGPPARSATWSSPSIAEWVVGSIDGRHRRGRATGSCVIAEELVDEPTRTTTTTAEERPSDRSGARSRSPATRSSRSSPAPGSWSPAAGRRAGCAAARSTPSGHLPPAELTVRRPRAELSATRRPARLDGVDDRPAATSAAAHRRGRDPRAACPGARTRTFLGRRSTTAPTGRRAIYKPHAGERPLWDFPDGLYRARGRGLRARRRRSAGTSSRPPSMRTTARSAIGFGAAVRRRRLRAALLHALEDEAPPRAARAHLRLRHRGQQHRPQGRPLPARRATAASGASTTACASTPSSSCAPSSGTSAASPSRAELLDDLCASSSGLAGRGRRPARPVRARRRSSPGRGPWSRTGGSRPTPAAERHPWPMV